MTDNEQTALDLSKSKSEFKRTKTYRAKNIHITKRSYTEVSLIYCFYIMLTNKTGQFSYL